jgi:hypothetical protein
MVCEYSETLGVFPSAAQTQLQSKVAESQVFDVVEAEVDCWVHSKGHDDF